MILKEKNNLPVCSADIPNIAHALTVYRSFKNDNSLTLMHFIPFLKTPSREKTLFFSLYFDNTYTVSNGFVKQQLAVK